MNLKLRRRGGFTLMEVLLVLAILVVLGSLAAVQFSGVSAQKDIDATAAQVGLLKSPVLLYQSTFGSYPPTLQALVVAPPDVDQAKWTRVIGPFYPTGLPKDPWGNEYKFAAPGAHSPNGYDIWSSGPDGVDGTEDDIGTWNIKQ